MKNLTVVIAVIAITLFGCTKRASHQPAPVQMSYEQLSKYVGDDNAFKLFDQAGKTETVTDNVSGRVVKKVKEGATLTVEIDLTLTNPSPDNYTCTTSENAKWSAFQDFVTGATPDPNAGAQSYCNHFYSAPGSAPADESCVITGTGTIRFFTSDFDYTVHLSNSIIIP
jgi:hypothetical protein